MPSSPTDLISLARAIAANHALDPALVCAVIEQESAWDAHAIRYEPAFRTRYVAPLGLPPTEEVARSISWGLMQVMGQVAREHNFSARFLSALCDPAAGIEIGCTVLVSKFAAAASFLHADASRSAAFTPSETRGVSPANFPSPEQLPSLLTSSPPSSSSLSSSSQLPSPLLLPSAHVAAAFRPAALLSDAQHQSPSPTPATQSQSVAAPFDPAITTRALQLWNGGGNPNYASEVLARLANYK